MRCATLAAYADATRVRTDLEYVLMDWAVVCIAYDGPVHEDIYREPIRT